MVERREATSNRTRQVDANRVQEITTSNHVWEAEEVIALLARKDVKKAA
jgi:hypothetical protein